MAFRKYREMAQPILVLVFSFNLFKEKSKITLAHLIFLLIDAITVLLYLSLHCDICMCLYSHHVCFIQSLSKTGF